MAVNGCSHGELDTIYATIDDIGNKTGRPIDLFISCGDFQAMRNVDDLHCFSAPPKYRAMKDFHKYYSGEKAAPVPTIFGATLSFSGGRDDCPAAFSHTPTARLAACFTTTPPLHAPVKCNAPLEYRGGRYDRFSGIDCREPSTGADVVCRNIQPTHPC